MEGYHIQATDGKIGHVDDLIIDDEDWQVVYAIVDTSNWVPWSRKVLISIEWMNSINYTNRLVKINLNTDTIKNGPEYHPEETINEKYERGLFDFYSRSLVK